MLGLLVCFAALGCSKNSQGVSGEGTAEKKATPNNPEQALYDQVRSGAYQIGSAIDSIEEVRKTSREIAARETGQTNKALTEIASHLNDAGKDLADYGDDPPSFEEFKKNFAAQDDKRLKAIDAANKSLDDMQDAQDLLEALLDSHPPEPENTELTNADSALDGCVQSVEDAIKAMGGKIDSDDGSDSK